MKKVAVIGDGGWGTALALVLHANGHATSVWGPFEDYIANVRSTRENTKFLPGIQLPEDLNWTANAAEALDSADVAVLATPTKFYSDVLRKISPSIPSACRLVSVAKGLDKDSHKRMSEVAEEITGHHPVAALSGPSHAEEVARGIPSAVLIACTDHDVSVHLQSVFSNPTFRVYTSDDVIGTELGGALKNVIAIAAGVCDGIGFGDNTKAALMTRGLAEMARLGSSMGAHPSTFSGLSGMGDLIVTCTSKLSRNRSVGERLGRGESMEAILKSMEQVAEGVWNCLSARDLAAEQGIDVPITDEVCKVVHEGKDPRAAVQDLLSRDPKPERG